MRLTPKRDGQLTEVGKPQAITYAESPKPLLSADKVKLQKELNPGGFTNKEVEFIKKAKGNGFTIEQTKAFIDKKRTQEQVGKEGIEKMQQPVKDILGGTAAGFASLGPNLAGGAMKLLGKDAGVGPFGGYMASKGIPVVPNGLEKAGQTMLDRGAEMENITTNAMGARPDAVGTQIGKQVAPIAATFAGGGAFGTTKLGSAGFKQVGQGLKQFNPMQIAQGLGKAAVAGAGEGLMYDAAESGGQNLGEMAGYGALGNAAIASLPIVGKVASKALGAIGNTAIGQPLKNASNKLYLSGLLNPKKLEYVANTLKQTGDDVDNVTEWMQQRVIKGTKTGIVDQLDNAATGTRGKVVETVGQLKGNVQDQSVKGAIESLVDAIGDPKSKLKQSKLAELQALLVKHDTTGLSWAEVQKVKEEMDDILDLFTVAGDVKAGQQKADLGAIRQELRTMLEKTAMDQLGVDIKMLNRDTAVAKALSKYIKYKDKTDAVREFLSPFASPFLGGVAGFTQGDTLETRIRNAVVGAIVGKVAGSTQIKTNTAFYLRKASNFFSKLTPAEKGFLSTVTKKLDDIEITPNSTVGGSGLPSASKSVLDSAIDSVPNAKGLMESIGNKLDEAVNLGDDVADTSKGIAPVKPKPSLGTDTSKGLKYKTDPEFSKGLKPRTETTNNPRQVRGLPKTEMDVRVSKNEYDLLSDMVDLEKGKPYGGWGMSIDKKQVGQYKSLEEKGILYIDSMGQGDFSVKFTDKGKDIITQRQLSKVDDAGSVFESIRKTSGENELSQIREQYGSTKGTILRKGSDEYVVTRAFYKASNRTAGWRVTKQVRNADGTVTSKGGIGGGDTIYPSQKVAQQQVNNMLSSQTTPKPTLGTDPSKGLPKKTLSNKDLGLGKSRTETTNNPAQVRGLPKTENSLITEAKKYKSADEFVKETMKKEKELSESFTVYNKYDDVYDTRSALEDASGVKGASITPVRFDLGSNRSKYFELLDGHGEIPKIGRTKDTSILKNDILVYLKNGVKFDDLPIKVKHTLSNSDSVMFKGDPKKYLTNDGGKSRFAPYKMDRGTQLRKIREEANPSKGLPKTENSLITEAKKYKSADEFVNNEARFYHGTKDSISKFDNSKSKGGTFGDGIYLTDSKELADKYAKIRGGKKGNTMRVFMDKNANILDLTTKEGKETLESLNPKTSSDFSKVIKEGGYDGFRSSDKGGTLVVFDAENIKTESQLRKIREEANK